MNPKVKLSDHSNYPIWKAQMRCLIESQELLHLIEAEIQMKGDGDNVMIKKYDNLVKGWIFGSMNENVLKWLVQCNSARELWGILESLFNQSISNEEGDTSSKLNVNAPSVSAIREDLKYIQASNVDVSNFVLVKLSGPSMYHVWKAQMLSLIQSQLLLHIIDAKIRFQGDMHDHMISKYDNLVKRWIFYSTNENVLKNIIQIETAIEIWIQLESFFGTPKTGIEGDSWNAQTEDLKYTRASNVNVSNFVSVKLLGRINYKIWKAQMHCLIESQVLLHIIDARHPFPVDKGFHMISQYDKLVKGWIFGTMSDHMLNNFADFNSAREVWTELESRFSLPIRDEKGSSLALYMPAPTEDLRYMLASTVNVSSFVSVKLSSRNNYDVWKTQMLCLVESHELLHIIHPKADFVWKGGPGIIEYDKLVKGWMLVTLNDELMNFERYERCPLARDLWEELESDFTNDIVGDSSDELDVITHTNGLKYMQASNVNVSSFVSVKLSGHNNYHIWKEQMLCMIKSQGLLHLTRDKKLNRFNFLVRGWILSTMTDEVLKQFCDYEPAGFIWIELESRFKDPPAIIIDDDKEVSVGFEFGIESITDVPELENTDSIRLKKELYEAAVEGCWWKAKSILKTHKNAATEAITLNGNTILHVSVEMGNNYFVEKLLGFLEDPEDIEKKNRNGWTALHMAAAVGNIDAAQLLVQKRKELLVIPDSEERAPFDIAFANRKLSLSAYLFAGYSTLPYSRHVKKGHHDESALFAAILAKQYDLTETLLKNFSNFTAHREDILMAVTITFPSDLTFMESFIYPSFHNVYQKTLMRGSLLFQSNFLDICFDDILRVVKICNNTCCNWLGKNSIILLVPIATLYPIYQLICILILMLRLTFSLLYFLLWKSLAVIVHPIKNIEKKKKEYRQAKKNLSIICDLMGDLIGTSSHHYSDSLFQAIVQDTYEVVDEILFRSPAAIDCKDDKGYNLIQSVIINRSEKVYKLIYHIIERTESYRDITDSSDNNLVHLAGRLAPSFVLDRTTGAALQLQQELLWFEEVKKLMLPIVLMGKNKYDEVKKLMLPTALVFTKNKYDETPAMVFTKEHKDLMKQGESWMKTTAESCSITAALIITIVFAAAITVPGGSNQESGIPLFRKKIAFTVFAVSNAFSLFTATTALLLFLSILTARYSEKDFKVSLPRRLILGLLTLFISTTAMMVAFGAILFLVFCDERPWMLAPICAFACLPISVIVTIKVPLLVDLIQSTYSPIFSKQGYLDSCKINRRNTLFKD